MREWFKRILILSITLILSVMGNSVCTLSSGSESEECSFAETGECSYRVPLGESEETIDFLLVHRWASLPQQSVLIQPTNPSDFKFLLRVFHVLSENAKGCRDESYSHLTHTTHLCFYPPVDYYVYTLEEILI